MPARVESLQKGKASKVMVKEQSLSGDQLVMTTGSQAVAHKVIMVQSIIPGDSQADALSAALQSILLLNALVLSSLKPRMSNGKSLLGLMKMKNGMTLNGSQRSTKHPRPGKVKEKDLGRKASPRARMLQDRLLQGQHSLHRLRMTDHNPKLSQKHVPA